MFVKKRVGLFFICVIIVAFATSTNANQRKEFHYVPKVDVYKVKVYRKLPIKLTYPARLKSFKDVIVKAQVSGILLKRFFKEGTFVKKGEALFLIDPSTYQAKLDQLKAELKDAKAELSYAKANYLRIKKSYFENLVSKDQYDKAEYEFKSAQARVKSIEAQVMLAKIYLSYTEPKSPISGFARMRKVDVGNLIDVGEPLVEIVKIDPIYAEFSIPDSDIDLVIENRSHLKVNLIVNGKKIPGKVDFIDRKIDRYTQTLKLRAVFNNRNLSLFPNEFVKVQLYGIYRKDEVLIPQRAVLQTTKGALVYLIVNSMALPRPVKIVGQYKNYFVVEGLKPGQIIAVDNLLKLRPNMRVFVDKTIK